MAKATRLTVRLDAEARAWLKREGGARGLDEAAFARMLVYAAWRGGDIAAPAVRPIAPAPAAPLAAGDAAAAALEALADEPRAEEIAVPANPDDDSGAGAQRNLDALMQAAPNFLDELVARSKPSGATAPAPRSPPRRLDPRLDPEPTAVPAVTPVRLQRPPPASPLRPDHRRGYGVAPGSFTRPVAVNQSGGNIQGDGLGNVMRDNMRHFGIVGTRGTRRR